MSKHLLVAALLSIATLPACAAPPTDIRPDAHQASQLAACQPAPCATLNAAELNFIGPLLMQSRDAAAQQYKAYDQVIMHLQSQINSAQPAKK